jgi:hypothetical protein
VITLKKVGFKIMISQISLKTFSEEGRWFLDSLQEAQNNLARKIKANIVIVNKKGSLVTTASSFSDFCNLLEENLSAKKSYFSPAQYAFDFMSKKKEAVFTNIYSNPAFFWVPLKDKEEKIIGAIAGCGGWYDYGETAVQKENILKDFYKQLGFNEEKCPLDKFLTMAKEIPIVAKDELRKEAFQLAKLTEILIEETDLKQAFSVSNSGKE